LKSKEDPEERGLSPARTLINRENRKRKGVDSPKLSARELTSKLKALPPSELDMIPMEELERFNRVGGVGW